MVQHWQKVKIEKGRYRNEQELVGYQETHPYYKAKPLYPALPETKSLFKQILTNLQLVSESYPAVQTGYKIFKLPQDRFDGVTEKDYPVVDRLKSLKTTLVTYVLIPKEIIKDSSIGYYYTPSKTKTLAEIVKLDKSSLLYSNLGFFVTRNEIEDTPDNILSYPHNKRYKDRKHHLAPDLYPFEGFYYIRDNDNIHSTFQGFQRSLVGIHHDGQLEIITHLPISSYEVYFGKDIKLEVNIIDPPDYPNFPNLPNSPILFTPNLLTPEIEGLRTRIEATYWLDSSWQNFAPYVGKGRINIFIANKGNGNHPKEHIWKVWEDRCPLPAFGAVLSFSKEYFQELFGSVEELNRKYLNQNITVLPKFIKGLAFYKNYKSIYGSFAPLVLNGKYLFNCDKEKIMLRLRKYGNFTSPMEMLGQETKTLAQYVREPKNVLFETENYIGNILFSGRYELSIGASLIDMTHITKILSQSGAFKEPIEHALILDSGSAARVVFAYKGKLYPLNIVAPGSRNKIGDPSGNFYSGLKITL